MSSFQIEEIEINLPDLSTQSRIASVLSAYDDLIENNEKRIKALEEMAQLLYTEWFVKFKFPHSRQSPGGQAGHQKVRMVDSGTEYGMIPEGWRVKRLGDVSKINSENLVKGAEPEVINYIDIASVSTGKIDNIQEVFFATAPGRARRILRHGDIIWSTVRPNRKSYTLVIKPVENLISSTGFAVIRASKIPYAYLYLVVTSDSFCTYLIGRTKGSAYPAVSSDDFEVATVLVPETGLLEKFNVLCEPVILEIDKLQKQNESLSEIRDLLIPQLVTGKKELA